MDLHIRAGKEDALIQEFLAQEWALVNQERFGWADQELWQKEHSTLWLEEEGKILGVALFWKMGGVGYLNQLLVAKGQRDRGLGTRLVLSYEERCRDCHKLALKTYKDSRSQRFYEELGYRAEAVLTTDLHGIDWVYMCKEGRV